MRNRLIKVLAFSLLVMSLLAVTTHAQKRHPPGRASAAPPALTPLYEEQKGAVAELLDQADRLGITFRYKPEEFADDAIGFAGKCTAEMDDFPDGRVKTLVLKVGRAYEDAGIIHGSLTGTSLRTRSYDAFNGAQKVKGGQTWDYLGGILARYGAEHLTPYDARALILHRAGEWSAALRIALKRSPVVR